MRRTSWPRSSPAWSLGAITSTVVIARDTRPASPVWRRYLVQEAAPVPTGRSRRRT
jgi:hypothetical protein